MMAKQSVVTVAIIGAGLIGPRHAQSIIRCVGAELSCIVDPSSSARAVAEAFSVPVFKSIQEMITHGSKPEAAIVCTPNSTHVPVSKELFAAGIHVLVEKPMSTTIQDGRDLIEAAKISGKHLLVGHHRRFNPYITAAKQALSSAIIGRPIALSGIWALYKPASYFSPPTEWRAQHDGGGVIFINMIHEVDILHYLFGPIVRVHAERTKSTRGNEAEEGAAIIVCFHSGLVGTFLIVDSCPSSHNFESGTGENPTIPQAGKDFIRVFGEEGTLSIGDMVVTKHVENEIKNWANPLQECRLQVGREVPFDEQIKNFVDVINDKATAKCTGEDALRAIVVCESIKQALADGRSVDVDTC